MQPSLPLRSVNHAERLARLGIDRANWYDRATVEIARVCNAEDWSIRTFTDTLAILSPRVSIIRNVRAALAYLGQGVHFPGTVRSVQRSLDIYNSTGKIGGRKVPYFARALKGDATAVTLDTWMAVAIARTNTTPTSSYFRRVATFERAEGIVRKVGVRLGLTPRDCQAAIWSGTFRSTGREPGYFPIWQEYQRWLAYDRKFPTIGSIDEHEEAVTIVDDGTDFAFGANAF